MGAARREDAKARRKSWVRRQIVGEEQRFVEGCSWLRLLSWEEKGWERGEGWTRSKCIGRMQGNTKLLSLS